MQFNRHASGDETASLRHSQREQSAKELRFIDKLKKGKKSQ